MVSATWLKASLSRRSSPKEITMMYAAITGALVLGSFTLLGLRKAKQNRDIFFFHED